MKEKTLDLLSNVLCAVIVMTLISTVLYVSGVFHAFRPIPPGYVHYENECGEHYVEREDRSFLLGNHVFWGWYGQHNLMAWEQYNRDLRAAEKAKCRANYWRVEP